VTPDQVNENNYPQMYESLREELDREEQGSRSLAIPAGNNHR
jgi:hypothetical protein